MTATETLFRNVIDLRNWHVSVEWKEMIHGQNDRIHVIGVIKSTGWTFENYLNNTSLGRHPCWCNRWPDTDRKLLIFWIWYCTTACSYIAAGALLFKIILLVTISYEVEISMWLQHTFTERRNHEIRWRACLSTCLKRFNFYRKNDRP